MPAEIVVLDTQDFIAEVEDVEAKRSRRGVAIVFASAALLMVSGLIMTQVMPALTTSKPAAASAWTPPPVPEVGAIVDGYAFLGGDPSRERSWLKIRSPMP